MEAREACAGTMDVAQNEAEKEREAITHVQEDNRGPMIKKVQRKRKAVVWGDFEEVKLPDNTLKVQCVHCKVYLAKDGTGSTSSMNRHRAGCTIRLAKLKKQRESNQTEINFKPIGSNTDEKPLFIPMVVYDHSRMRKAVAIWILLSENSFSVVEEPGFNFMMSLANPNYERISRKMVKDDCMTIYEAEKKNLKDMLKDIDKISLTTDMWKAKGQKISYMVITGHFIDKKWRLQKRVLSFVHAPPPHRGREVADAIFRCLMDWGIQDKIFSISVDNASYNDVCLRTLKANLLRNKKLVCDGELFHVRCVAHIINLMVNDGLELVQYIIEDLHDLIRFINLSELRTQELCQVVRQLGIHARKLVLPCPTRWNSTFEMLECAIKLKAAFQELKERDPVAYAKCPSPECWDKIEKVCKFLQIFSKVTSIVSGYHYPTSNLFLAEVFRVKILLDEAVLGSCSFLREMGMKMKEKFDKYWGECNLVMSIASVLDPRCKMEGLEMCFTKMYSPEDSKKNMELVKSSLRKIFEEYALAYGEEVSGQKQMSVDSSVPNATSDSGWDLILSYVRNKERNPSDETDLDRYISDGLLICKSGSHTDFSALEWWASNESKYPILSKMAVDIIAIPISTVASEATFSAGNRVLDPYRASLSPTTVEALICGGDWIRHKYGWKKKSKGKDQKDQDSHRELILPME